MRENYEDLTMEIIAFGSEDIICASLPAYTADENDTESMPINSNNP